ncbi:hypothetical protein A3J17_01320 [Candidatus Curtissbacteria bacterium RIFCSPLOWO2_02_FULL_40_11]|uniref:ZIP zinc transporter n=2 Tax=Candidatus Curtissiibacteriota TaxID=1752717 RepID=A0A1F5GBH3_9BACT|nr:MAG: hypothetical protein A3D04_03570 [Candidatus Curtissbacteria bacterium RIFCSPHIGHO2_02_FULL_40_16b]OGE00863.1 MAG: hypothetical protein A3J17_01320 [Candidatus Curtissbacteria bacterium RIFCSPLOWO2_02_FULL_40_11]OGE14051.1 MAG: hypothetical protein A3G14_03475 [Candidatus Curtissbacteria bacterium RIFCSPLOWO2_12_FULL_38_9]
MILAYIILFTFIGSIGSLAGSYFLLFKRKITEAFAGILIAFAAGALLATAFLDLFPEALEEANDANIFVPALLGFLSFFIAERYIRLFHYHHGHGEKPSTLLVLIGDGIHNFVDGVTIAVAFLNSIPLGITTSIAVAAHEIPQEIADMGVLLANGLSKTRAVIFNFLSALTALAGALIAFAAATLIENYLYFFLALAAGHFTYIAASDLIPEIHEDGNKRRGVQTLIFFALGILTVYIFTIIFEG